MSSLQIGSWPFLSHSVTSEALASLGALVSSQGSSHGYVCWGGLWEEKKKEKKTNSSKVFYYKTDLSSFMATKVA